MVCSEKLRRWSSSSIVLRRWVTGTPPVTHTYTRAIKQPTLHYLTRSVRRAAATCKQRLRTSEICRGNGPATSTSTPLYVQVTTGKFGPRMTSEWPVTRPQPVKRGTTRFRGWFLADRPRISLFRSQCLHRIDPRRPPCRNEAGQGCHN